MPKLISISLSPNTEKDDIRLAWKVIFQPWKWKSGRNRAIARNLSELDLLKEEFKKYLGVKYAVSFNSGRSAFLAILKNLELEEKSEILLQAFTCNAVVNPILWTGLKPVFVDANEKTFNIDTEDLSRKITSRSRAVIVQHTFGLPADLEEISEVCRENNLILVEDCAHSLGAEYHGKKVGTFGKVSFFSFSRDKVISSVYGGLAITNDEELANKLCDFQESISYPSSFWIIQQLLHPVLMNYLILPTYLIFGKYLLLLLQWFHILSKAVHKKEKKGEKPSCFPKRMPNALAILALNQFKKIERFNEHRREIADFYFANLQGCFFELPVQPNDRKQIFLRFTIKHPLAEKIIDEAWQKNILIGDWYTSPIAPADTELKKMGYREGICPKVEKLSRETLNLPTHINVSKEKAQKILEFLKKWQ